MKIFAEPADGHVRGTIPPEHFTVLDEFDIDVGKVVSVMIWKRSKEDCPFARGNWVADIRFKSGPLVCIKLPSDMEETAVQKYFQPLMMGYSV